VDAPPLNDALMRMRVEFIEMPDLKLTRLQARRLWNLSQELCDTALAALVRTGFLWETHDGLFLRRGLGRTAGFRARPEVTDAGETATEELFKEPDRLAVNGANPSSPDASEPGVESPASGATSASPVRT
jgi:hypothetical protein